MSATCRRSFPENVPAADNGCHCYSSQSATIINEVSRHLQGYYLGAPKDLYYGVTTKSQHTQQPCKITPQNKGGGCVSQNNR